MQQYYLDDVYNYLQDRPIKTIFYLQLRRKFYENF